MAPDAARVLFDDFVGMVRNGYTEEKVVNGWCWKFVTDIWYWKVATGQFGALMEVELVNDGPVKNMSLTP